MNSPSFWRVVRNDTVNIFEDMEPEEIMSNIQDLTLKIIESGIFTYHGPLDRELQETGNGGVQYLMGGYEQILECCKDYIETKEEEENLTTKHWKITRSG